MKRLLLFSICCVGLIGCKKSNNKSNDSPPAPAQPPEKAILTAPAQNSACVQGVNMNSNSSSITLQWAQATNADSYEVNIKNLNSGAVVTQTTSQTQLMVALPVSAPYSWYVVSKSSKIATTAQSDTWKFYNAGPGASNYTPFPADLTFPKYLQTVTATDSKVQLIWNGSDPDNDIVRYDIVWRINNSVIINRAAATVSNYTITVASGQTYFWSIQTTDSKGNTSTSDTYQFKVN